MKGESSLIDVFLEHRRRLEQEFEALLETFLREHLPGEEVQDLRCVLGEEFWYGGILLCLKKRILEVCGDVHNVNGYEGRAYLILRALSQHKVMIKKEITDYVVIADQFRSDASNMQFTNQTVDYLTDTGLLLSGLADETSLGKTRRNMTTYSLSERGLRAFNLVTCLENDK